MTIQEFYNNFLVFLVKNIGKPNDIIVVRTKQPKDLNMISKVG
jgi:hypothetical protein